MIRHVLVASFLAVGCSESSTGGGFGSASSSSGSSGSSSGSSGSLFDAGSMGDGGADGCSEESKLVYVISSQGDLYSFKPDQSKFTKIGAVNCPGGISPNSMAVDRKGVAWVNGANGALFKVSTQDATCQSTAYKPPAGWTRMGMGFASNAKGSSEETLYVNGVGGTSTTDLGLASIDLQTFSTKMIGKYTGVVTGRAAELTGTGNGDLYGFFTTTPTATLATIEKNGGMTSDKKTLDGVSTGTAWAFSYWGGDFWFYSLQPGQDSTSRVTRLKASGDGSISVAMRNVGFSIVGAGVSTCAPTRPPA